MNTNNIISNFIERMVKDGYSESRISRVKGRLAKLSNFMLKNNFTDLNEKVFFLFIKETYNFDYFNPTNNTELDKIKYLKNLLEFKNTGNYLKRHVRVKINLKKFDKVYKEYELYLSQRDIADITKQCKLIKIKLFLNSLDNINDIHDLKKEHCYSFINNLNYSLRYKEEVIYEVRYFLNWLYNNKLINYTGYNTFPKVVGQERSNIISYYEKEEIQRILDCVNINTKVGKRDYLILSFLVYYGLRISDIVHLKLQDINWNLNEIQIIQQKTGNILSLPIIDKIKYPLIDYIKNARKNIQSDYVFITFHAPFEIYNTGSFHTMITKYMKQADINCNNRHHGTHALRHSLASNLLSENIPITTISSILGHSTVKTTERYLTIDNKHLQDLSLEVPKNV